MFPDYQLKIADDYNISIGTVKKSIIQQRKVRALLHKLATSYDKKQKSTLHIRI